MKQINISVSFDDEKLRALNKYLKKKELTAKMSSRRRCCIFTKSTSRPLCVSTLTRTM